MGIAAGWQALPFTNLFNALMNMKKHLETRVPPNERCPAPGCRSSPPPPPPQGGPLTFAEGKLALLACSEGKQIGAITSAVWSCGSGQADVSRLAEEVGLCMGTLVTAFGCEFT